MSVLLESDLARIEALDPGRWYLRRGRIYSHLKYYGKRDRIYYKDGRLWRDTWVSAPGDPLREAMSFAAGVPRIEAHRLQCLRYDCKDFNEYMNGL